MNHVVLLGDSIFDNAPYIGGAPDVVEEVRQRLPRGSKATLNAIDGSMVEDVSGQLRRLPKDATHLIVSAGGNDALGSSDILYAPVRSTAEALAGLAGIAEQFEHRYHRMLTEVLAYELPTAICTVYYPCFPDPALQRVAVTRLKGVNYFIIPSTIP